MRNERVSLEQKSYIKYLGVLIDQNLSWRNHVNSVIIKISKTRGMIAKLRYFVPPTVLINIYNSLILPYITYGLIAWDNASNAHFNRFWFFKSECCASSTLPIEENMPSLYLPKQKFCLLRSYIMKLLVN